MSCEGMFVNDAWVAGRPSWYRKLRLRGRTRPYRRWVQVLFQLIGRVGWVPFLFLLGDWVGSGDNIRWDRAAIVFLGGLLWVIAWDRIADAPENRLKYRSQLAARGRLLAPETPAGQMVLIPQVRQYWDFNPDARASINRALVDFARGMAHGTRHMGGYRWYLHGDRMARQQWAIVSLFGASSPLATLGTICGCTDELSENIDRVISKHADERDADLRKQREPLLAKSIEYTNKLDAVTSKIEKLDARMAYRPTVQRVRMF